MLLLELLSYSFFGFLLTKQKFSGNGAAVDGPEESDLIGLVRDNPVEGVGPGMRIDPSRHVAPPDVDLGRHLTDAQNGGWQIFHYCFARSGELVLAFYAQRECR